MLPQGRIINMNLNYLQSVSLRRLRLKQELIRLQMFMAAFKKDQDKLNTLFRIDQALEEIIDGKSIKGWQGKKLSKVYGQDRWILK